MRKKETDIHTFEQTKKQTDRLIDRKTRQTKRQIKTRTVRKTVVKTTNTFHRQRIVCLLVGCLTSHQHASVSQGRICSDNCICCHTEIEVADPTFYLTQSQYTDTGPTSLSADPITPGAWRGSHWSANF